MAQNDAGTAAGGQVRTPQQRPKWTVMVYLADDNGLSANSIAIMQELEAASHRDDVRVLACFDSNTPRPKGSRYLEINHRRNSVGNGMNWGLHNDLVSPEERGEGHPVFAPDFCNPNPASVPPIKEPTATVGLDRFLGWALGAHPADKYMLILFGHGTAVAGKTFLTDDNPPSFLRLKEFRGVMAKHFGGQKRLNLLACDNCVMNGIETAFEMKDMVEMMLGSQGLMLTVGWPYRKIIDAVAEDPDASAGEVALKALRVCARNLLDFALMDRSSEQAVCDLTKLNGDDTLLTALNNLSKKLQECLYKEGEPEVPCPPMRDAVRLARLEAQSYWDETFTDIYDFCELLFKNCKAFLALQGDLLEGLGLGDEVTAGAQERLENSENSVLFRDVASLCRAVLNELEEVVPQSYYIGSDLQYSHGLSIYFPWTLPEGPYFFDPVQDDTRDFLIRTAFDEYETYGFAKPEAADWSAFLRAFFKATLRDVRTADRPYSRDKGIGLDDIEFRDEDEAPPVNLLKSTIETGKDGFDCTCPKIKNYPRRNYLSPADCRRRVTPGLSVTTADRPAGGDGQNRPEQAQEQQVSYLGWAVRGLVADVIKPVTSAARSSPAAGDGESPAPEPPAE